MLAWCAHMCEAVCGGTGEDCPRLTQTVTGYLPCASIATGGGRNLIYMRNAPLSLVTRAQKPPLKCHPEGLAWQVLALPLGKGQPVLWVTCKAQGRWELAGASVPGVAAPCHSHPRH